MNKEDLESDNALTIYVKRKDVKPFFDVFFTQDAISEEELEVAIRVTIIALNKILDNWQKIDVNKDDLK